MAGMAPNRAAAHSPAGSLPTTSSSGLLNDLEAGGRSNSFGQLYQQDESPDDMTTHREKNRLAQRKFRARQKVGALLCLASAAGTSLEAMCLASALHGPLCCAALIAWPEPHRLFTPLLVLQLCCTDLTLKLGCAFYTALCGHDGRPHHSRSHHNCFWVLQEKMKTSQKQLDELTKRVSMLMAEKSQLETRNRWADQVSGVVLQGLQQGYHHHSTDTHPPADGKCAARCEARHSTLRGTAAVLHVT